MKVDLDGDLYRNRLAVFCGRLKPPAFYYLYGFGIQTRPNRGEDADVCGSAALVYDEAKYYRSLIMRPPCFIREFWVMLRQGLWRRYAVADIRDNGTCSLGIGLRIDVGSRVVGDAGNGEEVWRKMT